MQPPEARAEAEAAHDPQGIDRPIEERGRSSGDEELVELVRAGIAQREEEEPGPSTPAPRLEGPPSEEPEEEIFEKVPDLIP